MDIYGDFVWRIFSMPLARTGLPRYFGFGHIEVSSRFGPTEGVGAVEFANPFAFYRPFGERLQAPLRSAR
jgi:hypothetical protein